MCDTRFTFEKGTDRPQSILTVICLVFWFKRCLKYNVADDTNDLQISNPLTLTSESDLFSLLVDVFRSADGAASTKAKVA